MLSKTKIKWINSLNRKKNRDDEGLFVAEGTKIVADLLPFLKCQYLVVSDEKFLEKVPRISCEMDVVSTDEYKKISSQKSPQGVLAVFEQLNFAVDYEALKQRLCLALDDIQDPGNLGTIIRIADWFGISDVFCSPHTADVYSPKAVQATMGAIARVRVHYVDLTDFLGKTQNDVPVFGTFMDGTNIYREALPENGIIVMGNEGNGVSDELLPFIDRKLTIPGFPPDAPSSESLNVGVAAAIVISEFRRNKFIH